MQKLGLFISNCPIITVLLAAVFLLVSSYPHDKKSCGAAFTGMYGSFKSPNFPEKYPDNLKCNWNISVPGGYYIDLDFSQFDLENYEECSYDYVNVITNGNKTVGKYCGKENKLDSNVPPRSMSLMTNNITVEFITDHSNEEVFHGFQAHYAARDVNECLNKNGGCMHICNNYIGGHYCSCKIGYLLDKDRKSCIVQCKGNLLREKTGIIQSPEYPKNYPPLADCAWNIAVDRGYSIILDFEDFNIEEHPDYQCPYDWLRVELADGHFKTLCGPKKPARIVSNRNWMLLTFHSDRDENKRGFKLRYHLESVSCPKIDPPANSKMRGQTTFKLNDIIWFECDEGYDLVGSSLTKCTYEGKWNTKIPKCKIRSCGKPDIPTGGSIVGSKYTYGSTVKYSCGVLYNMTGHDTRVCQANKTWSGTAPKCRPVCGRTKFPTRKMIACRPRISGGTVSHKGSHPWMVALWRNGRVSCGGTLLNAEWVLTAAHCVSHGNGVVMNVNDFMVSLGQYDIRNNGSGVQLIKVTSIKKHPDFTYSKFNADVALIRLNTEAKMTDIVRPICLPSERREKKLFRYGTSAMTAGWGQRSLESAGNLRVLNEVCIPIAGRESCSRDYQNEGFKITPLMFCAGKHGGPNVCRGDSGGPLVAFDDVKKRWILGGVVSWGSSKGCGHKYEVFARVTKLIGWIKKNAIFDLKDPFSSDDSSD